MNRDEALTECAMSVKPALWGYSKRKPFCGVTITWNEYQQRRAELINEPDDADAPEWARYKAQEADGKWFWHEGQPFIDDGEWCMYSPNDEMQVIASRGKVPAGHDWRKTLKLVNQDMSQNKPVKSRNEPLYDPRDVAFNREMNPPTSSLTDSQAREYAIEMGMCSDGSDCGQDGYCPNAPYAQDARRMDEQLKDSIGYGRAAPIAGDILNAAAQHMQDRASTYDKPQGERSMAATVDAFRATTGIKLTEEQGWHFMALLKLVRSQQGELRLDSYEDGAAYFALAGEAAAKHR